MKKVYIIRDKVANTYAGTPFVCESDDEAVRVFHFSAKSSPFRRDLELCFLCDLENCNAGFVSDFSESYLKRYEVSDDEEQA